jgi:hypothetical protein
MEHVFGGVRITTDDEVRNHGNEPDFRARPWLSGLSISSSRVTFPDHDDGGDR